MTQAARIEWGLGFLSAAVVLALAGYLVFEAATGSAALPDLGAAVLPAEPGDTPGQLRFAVRNDGGRTATAVAVSLVLYDDADAVVTERRLTVDYLPGHSEVTGGFLFGDEAPRLRPEIVVEGYLDP